MHALLKKLDRARMHRTVPGAMPEAA